MSVYLGIRKEIRDETTKRKNRAGGIMAVVELALLNQAT